MNRCERLEASDGATEDQRMDGGSAFVCVHRLQIHDMANDVYGVNKIRNERDKEREREREIRYSSAMPFAPSISRAFLAISNAFPT
jgi:hypothetical protein